MVPYMDQNMYKPQKKGCMNRPHNNILYILFGNQHKPVLSCAYDCIYDEYLLALHYSMPLAPFDAIQHANQWS